MATFLPKVSIIVPVYNALGSIINLIDSVQAQEEHSWELILVDDGSKDGSSEICDEISRDDGRITVIHQQNSGVSSARNSGLRAAKGLWITFVDADDLLTDTFLSSMLAASGKSDDIDIVFGSYAIVESFKTTLYLYDSKIYDLGKVKDAILHTRIMHRCSPWAKLFRRSVIEQNNLCFDTKLTISEDRLFLYSFMPFVRGMATTSTLGYIYGSFSPTSLKHKKHSIDELFYRQQKMTEGLKEVYRAFAIDVSEEYLMWKHLLMILLETMECVYTHYGCGQEAETIQFDILKKCFSPTMNDMALRNPIWKKIFESDSILQMVVKGDFNKYNRRLRYRDINLKIRQLLHKFFKKSSPLGTYKNSITKIN